MSAEVDAAAYLRRARICARVADWRGLEEAALGLLGEARRLQSEGPRDVQQGVGVVPDGGEVVVDAPEGGQLPRLDARRRREYDRFRVADPDAEVPERDLEPDEDILTAHGYTVADLPAPWERLHDGGASSR